VKTVTSCLDIISLNTTEMYCLMSVGGIQFAGTGELSDDPEPWRGRIHRSGEVEVSCDTNTHEKATAEFRSKSRTFEQCQAYSSVCVMQRLSTVRHLPREFSHHRTVIVYHICHEMIMMMWWVTVILMMMWWVTEILITDCSDDKASCDDDGDGVVLCIFW